MSVHLVYNLVYNFNLLNNNIKLDKGYEAD